MIRVELPKKRNKFGAKPVTVDGIRFHSSREAQRYLTLKLLVRAGDYRELKLQPRYPLMAPNMEKIGEYRADFEYVDSATKEVITEDVKGFATELFKWKAKHFEAQYGRKIRVTK